jgi:hypothetical protein
MAELRQTRELLTALSWLVRLRFRNLSECHVSDFEDESEDEDSALGSFSQCYLSDSESDDGQVTDAETYDSQYIFLSDTDSSDGWGYQTYTLDSSDSEEGEDSC